MKVEPTIKQISIFEHTYALFNQFYYLNDFIHNLHNLDFRFLTKGSYKHIFIHDESQLVLKVSPNGLNLNTPPNKVVKQNFLEYISQNRRLVFQPLAETQNSIQAKEYLLSKLAQEDSSAYNYLINRDCQNSNFGHFQNQPVLLDLNHKPFDTNTQLIRKQYGIS